MPVGNRATQGNDFTKVKILQRLITAVKGTKGTFDAKSTPLNYLPNFSALRFIW